MLVLPFNLGQYLNGLVKGMLVPDKVSLPYILSIVEKEKCLHLVSFTLGNMVNPNEGSGNHLTINPFKLQLLRIRKNGPAVRREVF